VFIGKRVSKFFLNKGTEGQNRRQKVFNKGPLRFCGGALRLWRGGLTQKIDKNSIAS